tara:strand:+ start:822 stop:1103 length:282 start_codon:yes stop_codon:yes gene_type:complete
MSVERAGLATVVFAGSVAAFALGGMFSAFSDGYFLGRARKKGVTYKNIARRNAVMGGVFGALGAYAVMVAPEKEAERATSEGMFGIGNPPNVY